jgi:galactan endo-1,6-beta-galactosidase
VFGQRDDLADLFFTTREVKLGNESLPGLGFTIARYNAGACGSAEVEGRRMVVSKTIRPFRQIDAFWLDGKNSDPASASWNWNADPNQRAMLLKARERGADRFELFSNSPPWWMCANRNPSGAAKADQENLPSANYAAFAHYLAAIARRARDQWGVAFTTVDPFNEPSAHYWFANGKQEGCFIARSSQAAFLPIFRAALDRHGLSSLPISASDETSYDHAVETWQSFTPEIRDLVAQVNVHGYQGRNGRRDFLHDLVVRQAGKRLWNSEYGDEHADGLELAANLQLDLHWLRPSAWCYWQPLDGGADGGWGLLPADLDRATIGRANPKYFVLAHYSRHIRPGMRLLTTGDWRVAAAHDANSRRLVILVFNDSKQAAPVRFDLTALKGGSGETRVRRWLTEPLAQSRYRRLPDERLAVANTWKFPPRSVVTLEIDDMGL